MEILPCPHNIINPFRIQKQSGHYLETQGEQKAIINEIEEILESDVISYYGYIHEDLLENFYEILKDGKRRNKLTLILFTPGGFSQNLKSFSPYNLNYSELVFIIPELAASAGTIWALSGTAIYFMENSIHSPLTKIDPLLTEQIDNIPEGKSCIPLLDYYYRNLVCVRGKQFQVHSKNQSKQQGADRCQNYIQTIENILDVVRNGNVIQPNKFDTLLNALLNISSDFQEYCHTKPLPQNALKEMGLTFQILNEHSQELKDKISKYDNWVWANHLVPQGKDKKQNPCLIQNRDYYVE